MLCLLHAHAAYKLLYRLRSIVILSPQESQVRFCFASLISPPLIIQKTVYRLSVRITVFCFVFSESIPCTIVNLYHRHRHNVVFPCTKNYANA